MAVDPEEQQDLVDRIMAIFTNEAEANSFGEDPQGYIDENLPDGVEPGDIASCMPEVGEQLGGNYASNLAGYNSASTAATNSVVNEIAYTYNTTYQQNTFIYAEEGSQVTNIQGDGNAVSQQQIDADFNVGDDYGTGEEYPEEEPELPEEEPVEEDGDPMDDMPEEPEEPEAPEEPPMDGPPEAPPEVPTDDGGDDGADDMPDM